MTANINTINHVTSKLETLMVRFGYQMMETPLLDKADLFLTKAGDQVIEQLFVFEHRGQQWALRPEFTASATYHYVQSMNDDQNQVARWQYYGLVFENQSHLQHQHYQRHSVGAELIGASGISADAEMIAMAAQGMEILNVPRWQLVIGQTGLLRQLLTDFNLDDRILRFLLSQRHALRTQGKQVVLDKLDQYLPENLTTSHEVHIDNVDTHQVVDAVLEVSGGGKTMGGRTRADVSRRLLKKRQQATQRNLILDAIDFLALWTELVGTPRQILSQLQRLSVNNTEAKKTVDKLSHTLELLNTYGISFDNITLMPDLARHWDYYTGIVFEIRSNTGNLLCGGGRYDGLAKLIGSQSFIPAIGMAYQIENVAEFVEVRQESNDFPILLSSDSLDHIPQWANRLREQGITTIIQFEAENNLEGVSSSICLFIEVDGQIFWNDTSYSLEDVEKLIQAINEVNSNDE